MLGWVLGVWLLLVTIFFGFFGAKFRKKLKFYLNGFQGSLWQGDMKPSRHPGAVALSSDLRNNRNNEMIDDCDTGYPP